MFQFYCSTLYFHCLKGVLVAMPTVVERFVDWTVLWLGSWTGRCCGCRCTETRSCCSSSTSGTPARVQRGEAAADVMVFEFQGAGHVYDGFLHPLVARHEADIDRALLELRARARDVTVSQLKAAAAIGQVWLVEAARCVSSQLQAVRSGCGARVRWLPPSTGGDNID